ncbi:hypothetical protein [Roseivirga sp.]|uniref:hypothetical protein n=1 Tax=Roseivirga sp. TaxID=1964215 RepID=UPI003B52252A
MDIKEKEYRIRKREKITARIIVTYCIIIMLLLLAFSCRNKKGPAEPNPQELTFEKLAGQWELGQFGSIQVDGVNLSVNYPGFALSFGEQTYTTTNAGQLFKSGGTWEWLNEEATQISLDDGKVITINSLTTDQFVFSFTKSDGPVSAGIAGSYQITVEK